MFNQIYLFIIIKPRQINKMDTFITLDVFFQILKIDSFQTDFASLKCVLASKTREIQPANAEYYIKEII